MRPTSRELSTIYGSFDRNIIYHRWARCGPSSSTMLPGTKNRRFGASWASTTSPSSFSTSPSSIYRCVRPMISNPAERLSRQRNISTKVISTDVTSLHQLYEQLLLQLQWRLQVPVHAVPCDVCRQRFLLRVVDLQRQDTTVELQSRKTCRFIFTIHLRGRYLIWFGPRRDLDLMQWRGINIRSLYVSNILLVGIYSGAWCFVILWF